MKINFRMRYGDDEREGESDRLVGPRATSASLFKGKKSLRAYIHQQRTNERAKQNYRQNVKRFQNSLGKRTSKFRKRAKQES